MSGTIWHVAYASFEILVSQRLVAIDARSLTSGTKEASPRLSPRRAPREGAHLPRIGHARRRACVVERAGEVS
jgi:hypothetical protein